MSQSIDAYQQGVSASCEKITEELYSAKKELERFHTAGFWMKTLAAILVAVGSILAVLLKLHSMLPSK
jgi:hypothetical protein